MTKMKTLKLRGPVLHPTQDDPNCYRVLQVKNSTDPKPDQVLTKKEVDDFCLSSQWDVTIIGLSSGG